MTARFFSRLVIWAVLLHSATAASAFQRRLSPMSEWVRRASFIAIVDAGPRDERGQIALTPRETLKGETQIVVLPRSLSTEQPLIPPDARGWAALLAPTPNGLELLESYQQPEQIEVLRQVVKIAAIPLERERLEAWRALLPDANPLYSENFLWELREMRDPANFPLLLDSLDELEEASQPNLVQLVGEIGDARGLPKLIEWMNRDSTLAQRRIAVQAAHQLEFGFPGAPGVTEAFRAASQKEGLKAYVASYLTRRDPKLLTAFQTQTPYLRAQTRAEAGDLIEARHLWLAIAEEATTNDYTRLDVASRLAKARQKGTAGDFERERRALLPHLTRLARDGDYSQLESVATLASGWHHPDAIAPLLLVLGRKSEWILEKSQRIAFAGLWELGPQAQKQAATVLKARLQSEKADYNDSFDSILIPLCWLSAATDDAQIAALLDPSTRRQWETFAPLRVAARAKDETAALIDLLQQPDFQLQNPLSWVIFRLGEKRDPRALPVIAKFLSEHPYQLQPETSAAIVRIGGPQAEAEIVKLLRAPDEETRRKAVDLLVALQGARALPLLRRMVNEADFGSRAQAIFQLTYFGTPEDLPRLLGLSDYWTGDRANHGWIMGAIANIRYRFRLDVNGPIDG